MSKFSKNGYVNNIRIIYESLRSYTDTAEPDTESYFLKIS